MSEVHLQSVVEMIDRKRRAACNEKTTGEGSKMYYEGMRVGLYEAQHYAEQMLELCRTSEIK